MKLRPFGSTPVAVLLAVAVFATLASATTLSPGQSVCASGCTFSPIQDFAPGSSFFTGAPLASTGLLSFSTTTYSGTLQEWVVTDTNTGGLDFLYQVSNSASSTDAIEHVSVADYTGFSTNVGYCSSPGCLGATGSIAPLDITRNLSGGTIDFGFSGGPSPLFVPNSTTYDLVVKTNATTYGGGTTSIIDSHTITLDTLAPTPEPVSASLLLSGLFGIGLLAARKRQARHS